MIDDVDQYVAKKLKYYRTKFHWPLKKLADELGVSLQQMHRYEQGANRISAGLLYKFSKLFNLNLSCFYDHFEEDLSTPPQNPTILLIEDNPDDEYFFRKCATNFDDSLNIYVIREGEEALSYFRELQGTCVRLCPHPDIIFMDLSLPQVTGFDLLSDLRKRPALSTIPSVVLTGSMNPEDITRAYSLHASGFIKKSFIYEEYSLQLERALSYWLHSTRLPSHATTIRQRKIKEEAVNLPLSASKAA